MPDREGILDEGLAELLRPLVRELVREEVARVVRHESPYLNVEEAAAFLRAKPQRVYDLLSEGQLTRVKDGSRVLVSRAELKAYLGQAAARKIGRSRK